MGERKIISIHLAEPGWRCVVCLADGRKDHSSELPVTKWVISESNGYRLTEPAVFIEGQDVLLRHALDMLTETGGAVHHELFPPGMAVAKADLVRVADLARDAYKAREQRLFEAFLAVECSAAVN
jgi:hypothetical protein